MHCLAVAAIAAACVAGTAARIAFFLK